MALHVTNHVRPEALAQQKRLMSDILTRVAQATAAPHVHAAAAPALPGALAPPAASGPARAEPAAPFQRRYFRGRLSEALLADAELLRHQHEIGERTARASCAWPAHDESSPLPR